MVGRPSTHALEPGAGPGEAGRGEHEEPGRRQPRHDDADAAEARPRATRRSAGRPRRSTTATPIRLARSSTISTEQQHDHGQRRRPCRPTASGGRPPRTAGWSARCRRWRRCRSGCRSRARRPPRTQRGGHERQDDVGEEAARRRHQDRRREGPLGGALGGRGAVGDPQQAPHRDVGRRAGGGGHVLHGREATPWCRKRPKPERRPWSEVFSRRWPSTRARA